MLSGHEVYEDGASHKISISDTSYNNTKQLDYYKNQVVTTSSYAGAIKQYNGSNSWWWLRSVDSGNASYFLLVDAFGSLYYNSASYSRGVSPAFRIA